MSRQAIATITGLVLAGGLGRRMGSVDKGLQPLAGRPMVEHVLERLGPQVGGLLINANRNLEAYARFGHPVVSDRIEGFAGPLAGLHAGLVQVTTPLLCSAPCDSPFLPLDLVERLHAALDAAGAAIAVARAGGRMHPVFCLCRRELADGLAAFLAAGGRRVEDWHAGLSVAVVDFDDESTFGNINTLDELSRFG